MDDGSVGTTLIADMLAARLSLEAGVGLIKSTSRVILAVRMAKAIFLIRR